MNIDRLNLPEESSAPKVNILLVGDHPPNLRSLRATTDTEGRATFLNAVAASLMTGGTSEPPRRS